MCAILSAIYRVFSFLNDPPSPLLWALKVTEVLSFRKIGRRTVFLLVIDYCGLLAGHCCCVIRRKGGQGKLLPLQVIQFALGHVKAQSDLYFFFRSVIIMFQQKILLRPSNIFVLSKLISGTHRPPESHSTPECAVRFLPQVLGIKINTWWTPSDVYRELPPHFSPFSLPIIRGSVVGGLWMVGVGQRGSSSLLSRLSAALPALLINY